LEQCLLRFEGREADADRTDLEKAQSRKVGYAFATDMAGKGGGEKESPGNPPVQQRAVGKGKQGGVRINTTSTKTFLERHLIKKKKTTRE